MEKAVNYYNFAENDYCYLKANVEEGRISNAMCSSAQNICERYLKSAIEKSANEMMNTEVMKTHSLKKIKRFIESFVPEFQCDWKTVIQADGYYFSARYPGDDSFFVGEDDVSACWDAVEETKRATDLYLGQHQIEDNKRDTGLDLDMHKEKLLDGMNESSGTKHTRRKGR